MTTSQLISELLRLDPSGQHTVIIGFHLKPNRFVQRKAGLVRQFLEGEKIVRILDQDGMPNQLLKDTKL